MTTSDLILRIYEKGWGVRIFRTHDSHPDPLLRRPLVIVEAIRPTRPNNEFARAGESVGFCPTSERGPDGFEHDLNKALEVLNRSI